MMAFLHLGIPGNRYKQHKTWVFRLTLRMADIKDKNEQTEKSVCSFLFSMPGFPPAFKRLYYAGGYAAKGFFTF